MTIQQYLIDNKKAVLITVCCVCHKMQGIKAGFGCCGISHSYCPTCYGDIKRKKISQ